MNSKNGLGIYQGLDLKKSSNDEEIKKIYEEWASQYDADNDAVLGTVSQPSAVKLLSTCLTDLNATILDVGCGTGLVGKYLSEVGFTRFDGIDISEDMLAEAQNRGYRHLLAGSLNDKLPIEAQSYDACLCVGVFTHGHVGLHGLDELIRITKSGGYICFTVNEGIYDDYGFDEAISNFEKAGTWRILTLMKDAYMTKKMCKAITASRKGSDCRPLDIALNRLLP